MHLLGIEALGGTLQESSTGTLFSESSRNDV